MALQIEEKDLEKESENVTISGGSLEHIHYPEIDEIAERKEGMRIVGEALARDVLRYSGQAVVVFALVGAIAALGFWGVSQLQYLPGLVSAIAKPFLPAPQAPPTVPASKTVEGKADKADKPHVALAPRHHHRAHHKPAPPGYDYRRGPAPYTDNPTGGQIIYQDSMITEYRWNK